MLARFILSISALAATAAIAAPSLYSRAQASYVFHYGIGSPVACPGITAPTDGAYAAVFDGNPVGAVCGERIVITSKDGKQATNVLVSATFQTCDSQGCAPTAVQVSESVFDALAPTPTPIFFPGTYALQK